MIMTNAKTSQLKKIVYMSLMLVVLSFSVVLMSACGDETIKCSYGTYYAHNEHNGTPETEKYLVYEKSSIRFVDSTSSFDKTATQITDSEKEITFADADFVNVKLVKDSKNCFAYYEGDVLVCYYTLAEA